MKKQILNIAIVLILVAVSASARLRVLGEIGSIGVVDGDPDHIAIVLANGCEWDAVASTDGGETWRVANRAELPASLQTLPFNGDIRYRLVDNKLLMRSTDAGATWRNVSPWSFLSKAIVRTVDEEKARFMKKYAMWLPENNHWTVMFGSSAIVLLGFSSFLLARKQRQWIVPVFMSTAVYLFIGIALWWFNESFTDFMKYGQWQSRLGHWEGGVTFPLWPMGIVLHLTGNFFAAPVASLFCFPMTCLFWETVKGSTLWQKRMRVCGTVAVSILLAVLAVGVFFGRGWDYGV